MTQCAVYRHFNAAGELLYVGQSVTPLKRNCAHRSSDWFEEIATITLEWFPTPSDALHAEMKAIDEEGPRHNLPRSRSGSRPRDTPGGYRRGRSLTNREADARVAAGETLYRSKGYWDL